MGCECYDWEQEVKSKTFFWYKGSWVVKSNDGDFRRIYYCPMCGEKLEK